MTGRNYGFIELNAVFSMPFGHVTDGVTTMRLSWTLVSCEVLLTSRSLLLSALNCHSYRLLTSPLANAPVQSHLNFQIPDVNWQFPFQ